MERESFGTYLKRLVAQSGMAGKLLVINIAVFLFFLVLTIIEKLGNFSDLSRNVKEYFVGPGTFGGLIERPWTIITQMFTHGDFGHLLFNCIALYFLGKLLTSFLGERRLLTTYIFGGIFAYLFHILIYAIFPSLSSASLPSELGGGVIQLVAPGVLGASGAVMAIFVAAAVYKPSYRILFFGVLPVQLFVLAAIYFVIDLTRIGNSSENIAYMAHIGGALFGWISVIGLTGSYNIMNGIERLLDRLRKDKSARPPRTKSKLKVIHNEPVTELTDEEYNANKAARQARVDAILEKIHKKGYESLTQKEKDILFHESKR